MTSECRKQKKTYSSSVRRCANPDFLCTHTSLQSDANAYRQPRTVPRTRTMRTLPASTRVIKCVTSILAPQCPDAWRFHHHHHQRRPRSRSRCHRQLTPSRNHINILQKGHSFPPDSDLRSSNREQRVFTSTPSSSSAAASLPLAACWTLERPQQEHFPDGLHSRHDTYEMRNYNCLSSHWVQILLYSGRGIQWVQHYHAGFKSLQHSIKPLTSLMKMGTFEENYNVQQEMAWKYTASCIYRTWVAWPFD